MKKKTIKKDKIQREKNGRSFLRGKKQFKS
jgi:hypothetical protein